MNKNLRSYLELNYEYDVKGMILGVLVFGCMVSCCVMLYCYLVVNNYE